MKALKWLDEHLEEMLLMILLVVITFVSFLQVVIRKVPWIPALTWAEEFCRFCWIWSVFLSLPYTMKKGNMLRVTALLDILPEMVMKVLNISVYCISTICMMIMAFYSVSVVGGIKSSGELSPAMRWPMWIIYSMMMIGFTLAIYRGFQQIYYHTKHINEHELSTAETAMEDARKEAEIAKGGME